MKTITVPDDHQIGMVVPEGGSNCAKCVHVSDNERECDEPNFVKWNGSKRLPAPANRYCCDFFAAAKGASTLGTAMRKQRARK